MKKVLIVSIAFPPDANVGSLRPGAFAKYLPSFGWTPITITKKINHLEKVDICELKDLSKYGRIVRTSSFPHPMQWYRSLKGILTKSESLNRVTTNIYNSNVESRLRSSIRKAINTFLYIPDEHWGWITFAVLSGIKIAKKENIKVIYSTGPPWSSHLAAFFIQLSIGCRWIADFRDPWARNPWQYLESIDVFAKKIHSFLEKKTVNRANKILCVTDENAEDFKNVYHLDADKVTVIPNGYDIEEFQRPTSINVKNHRFTLTHIGSLYGRRDPVPLVQSVINLINKGFLNEGTILLRFVGDVSKKEAILKVLNDNRMNNIVEFVSPVQRNHAIKYIHKSDLLIVIQGDASMQIPVKLYEYIATGKPIFAMATAGATKNIIEKDSFGVVVDPYDNIAIEKTILEYYNKWSRDKLYNLNSDKVHRYERKYLTGLFANLLDYESKLYERRE